MKSQLHDSAEGFETSNTGSGDVKTPETLHWLWQEGERERGED